MVRVGVIGAGFMGAMHSQCYALLPGVKLVAIADCRKEKAAELATKLGCNALEDAGHLLKSSEVDAVDVCLPTFLHKEWVVKSARAGKHVLCEKPIALTVKDADKMVEVTGEQGVVFMVAQVIRFWPEYVRLKEIYQKRELGSLLSLHLTRLSPTPIWSWENWMVTSHKSGGALVDLHIHDTDYLQYLLGQPKSLYSVGRKVDESYWHIMTFFKYPDLVVTAEGAWDFVDTLPFRMAFVANFEKGVVEYNSRYPQPFAVHTQGKTDFPVLVQESPRSSEGGGNISALGGYYNEIKYFVECIEKKEKPVVVTPTQARDSLDLVLKEFKSAEKGKEIRL